MRKLRLLLVGVCVLGFSATALSLLMQVQWTEQERTTIESLWLGNLGAPPADPSNRVADDPDAARFGHRLFFDTRLSSTESVSCASCHQPERFFTDGLPLAVGVGTTARHTPTIVGAAYSPWLFWDGRKDSLWAQALGPMESAVEHGGSRTQYAHVVGRHYVEEYEALFGSLPDLSDLNRFPSRAGPVEDAEARSAWESMTESDREAISAVYSNLGKALAAYERKIAPGPTRFDRYVEALSTGDPVEAASLLSDDEIAGLQLFIGKAECVSCHNGPLFTNNDFHNIGVPDEAEADLGRQVGVKQVLEDEFNCLSGNSDAEPSQCAELRFAKTEGPELMSAFRTPTLRNIAETGPYMHAGQFDSLREVLVHYNEAPAAASGRSELEPLDLSGRELEQLEAFLHTLSGELASDPVWLSPPNR